MTMLVALVEPSLSAISAAGIATTCVPGAAKSAGNASAVVKDESRRSLLHGQISQRELIHRHEHIGARDQGRPDPLFRQAHVAVRAARTHLGAIRRQPADFQRFTHAISIKSWPSNNTPWPPKPAILILTSLKRCACFRAAGASARSFGAISRTSATVRCGGSLPTEFPDGGRGKTFSGKIGVMFSRTQRRASTGSLLQIVGHGDRIRQTKSPCHRAGVRAPCGSPGALS